jgi:hypothetical protein
MPIFLHFFIILIINNNTIVKLVRYSATGAHHFYRNLGRKKVDCSLVIFEIQGLCTKYLLNKKKKNRALGEKGTINTQPRKSGTSGFSSK